jgi:hypothetical protein
MFYGDFNPPRNIGLALFRGKRRQGEHLCALKDKTGDMITIPSVSPTLVHSIALGVQARSHGRVRNLNVLLDGGAVVLRGEARSHHTKQLAQDGALDLIEDLELVNQIVVI